MLNRFGFLLVLGFSCLLLCEGKIFPPSNGTGVTIIPGSTEKIVWSFDDDIKSFTIRTWTFTPSDGRPQVGLARIQGDGDVQILNTSYEFAVEKPATLLLENVNLTYNGTYEFSLLPGPRPSEVMVYIAEKPNKTKIEVPKEAYVGEKLDLNCDSEGFPPPNFTITHNVTTNIASNQSRYIKDKIDYSDAGLYECVATNILGNDTDSDNLIVKVWNADSESGGLSPGAIAGICVAVLVLVVLVIFSVVYYEKKKNEGRNRFDIGEREKDTSLAFYIAVKDKKREENMLPASFDTDAMKQGGESKKEPANRTPQTEYAIIDFAKTANAPRDGPA